MVKKVNKSMAYQLENLKGTQKKLDKFLKDLPCKYCYPYTALGGKRYYCSITGFEVDDGYGSPIIASTVPCHYTEAETCKLLSSVKHINERKWNE